MGARANLILVENNKPKIYFSQWEGQKTSKILAQGLEFCENHFKQFNEDGWLMNNAWSEGGILIDKDNKVILFFDADFMEIIALRNLFIDFIQKNSWIDWHIEWVDRGNVDFAEYLGLMEDYILADGCIPNFPKLESLNELINQEEYEMANKLLITIINNNIIKDYLISSCSIEINFCLADGITLKDNLPSVFEVDAKNIKEIEIEEVLLVDYDKKEIYVCWFCETDDRHIEAVKTIWSGWDCKRQKKGVEFNFEYTQRAKSYIKITEKEFNDYLEKRKLLEYN